MKLFLGTYNEKFTLGCRVLYGELAFLQIRNQAQYKRRLLKETEESGFAVNTYVKTHRPRDTNDTCNMKPGTHDDITRTKKAKIQHTHTHTHTHNQRTTSSCKKVGSS